MPFIESPLVTAMVSFILLTIAAVVVVLLAIIALKPADFRITRRTTIAAPPAAAFAYVNDFHQWEVWSPWAKLDPNMKQTFDGAPSGVGAVQSWSGNNKVGEGRATIIASQSPNLIRVKLEFLKPFAATNTAEFTFQPEGSQTAVVWSMTGKNNFMAKAFDLFMNMDELIGRDFKKGLAQLKAAAEAPGS